VARAGLVSQVFWWLGRSLNELPSLACSVNQGRPSNPSIILELVP
jgi:hypothetical protein